MVVQGVKNPLVDLLSLEDKTLDEVRFSEMISQLQPLHVNHCCFPLPLSLSALKTCFMWHRVMDFAQHNHQHPMQTGQWRRVATMPLLRGLTITVPWCWQQARARGKEKTLLGTKDKVCSVCWIILLRCMFYRETPTDQASETSSTDGNSRDSDFFQPPVKKVWWWISDYTKMSKIELSQVSDPFFLLTYCLRLNCKKP